jgi:hypothetical protein
MPMVAEHQATAHQRPLRRCIRPRGILLNAASYTSWDGTTHWSKDFATFHADGIATVTATINGTPAERLFVTLVVSPSPYPHTHDHPRP